VNSYAVLLGALLLSIPPLRAQEGTVHIRVSDPKGSGISNAVVSLRDGWGRLLATRSTNSAGELVWTRLPLGSWYFFAEAAGFYFDAAGIAICEGALEHAIALQLASAPEQGSRGQVDTVESANAMIEMVPIPVCQALALPPPQRTPPGRH